MVYLLAFFAALLLSCGGSVSHEPAPDPVTAQPAAPEPMCAEPGPPWFVTACERVIECGMLTKEYDCACHACLAYWGELNASSSVATLIDYLPLASCEMIADESERSGIGECVAFAVASLKNQEPPRTCKIL